MKGKVTCPSCGWSWNKSDSSQKDMHVCHNCGKSDVNMKNGGWLDNYEQGGMVLKQKTKDNYGKKPNPNDVTTHTGPNYVGSGYDVQGRDYSPAWGGMFQGGGSVYPVNYVPQAQNGFHSGNVFIDDKMKDWFGTNVKGDPKIINIVDSRKKLATTNKALGPNSDLVSGKYNSEDLDNLIKTAKQQGLSKEDIMNLSAMGFQETKWGRTDDNIGHVIGDWKGKDQYEDLINAYTAKMKEADRLGIKDPAMRLQVYNGLGTIYPTTENKYHGFNMKKIYGVPVPPQGISMKENPLYGKQVIDIRDNVLGKNPEYTKYLDSIYNVPLPHYEQYENNDENIDIVRDNNNIHSFPKTKSFSVLQNKKAQGGMSIPGAVGFSYARTQSPAPSNGPYAKKTKASAQNGEEMEYYKNGLDWKPKSISQNGKIIKDDMGYWNPENWGKEVEIDQSDPNSFIDMEGVYEPLLGVSDKGEKRIMYPGEKHKFKKGTKKVIESPIAQNGLRQEQKGLVNLDQLTNFTNYNTKQPGGWLDQY